MAKQRYNPGMEYADKLRENLRNLIDADAFSTSQVAVFAGLHVDTIYKFLRGDIKDIGTGNAKSLAVGLGISLDKLTEGSVKIPSNTA